MYRIDVLTGYFVCAVGCLAGAVIMRMTEAPDDRTRQALRTCAGGFAVFGLCLLPAGLGEGAAHPLAQYSIGCGAVVGLLLIIQGLGRLQGHWLTRYLLEGLMLVSVVSLALALRQGAFAFGVAMAAELAAVGALAIWVNRGTIVRPRDLAERALGYSVAALVVTSFMRLAFTLSYSGPVRVDLMYVPPPLDSIFAALYAVLPMLVSTLMMIVLNARLSRQLRMRAINDELTGTMTRRALRELVPGLLDKERHQRDVAVMMIDLDRFKSINDNYGHAMGDAVLRTVGALLQSHMRADSLLGRYGGEEFVAVIPVNGLHAARHAAERLRLAVQDADWRSGVRLDRGVTVSMGVVLVSPGESFDSALQRADEALYRAKRDGRNQCQMGLVAA
jgi:diguanylate cyclase (GGDEF)-like protein